MKIEQEYKQRAHLLAVAYLQMKAAENAASKEAKSVMQKEEKHLYDIAQRSIRSFCYTIEKRFDAATKEYMDNQSYVFMDFVSLLNDPKNKHIALDILAAAKSVIDGDGAIVDENGKKIRTTEDFLAVK
jgi:hypothetical protein